jgi:hypothetical protein
MTYRNPNFIATVVPYQDVYGPRMTFFYGLPNQLYFARAPKLEEIRKQEQLQGINRAEKPVQETNDFYANRDGNRWGGIKRADKWLGQAIGKYGPYIPGIGHAAFLLYAAQGGVTRDIREKVAEQKNAEKARATKLAQVNEAIKGGFIRPFRNYHMLTSSKHIIANNIKASSRDVANTVVIKYAKDPSYIKQWKQWLVGKNEAEERLNVKASETEFTLKIDCSLPTEETRTQVGQFINVTNDQMAKRYALALLLRNVKEIYKGEVIILGNPNIKPYDVCYLMDEYTDMIGAFEVEEVQHVFDQEHGFRTEIKPDMLATAAEWSLITSAEALGVLVEGALRQDTKAVKGLNLGAKIVGYGMNLFGGFMSDKIIHYTQTAQPIIMAPLLHHGMVFTGGIPARKMPISIWRTLFKKWDSLLDSKFDMFWDDAKESMVGWIDKITGRHMRGDFLTNFGGERR